MSVCVCVWRVQQSESVHAYASYNEPIGRRGRGTKRAIRAAVTAIVETALAFTTTKVVVVVK